MYQIEARTIMTPQNGINIYRGSTDNCIVSKVRARGARVKNPEEMGIKADADQLLSVELRKKRSRGIIYTGLSDPYNELERESGIMRKCLMAVLRFDFGIDITTRRSLILRDKDLLKDIADRTKCIVRIVLPCLKKDAFQIIEGDKDSIDERLEILEGLKDSGVDIILDVFPMLPELNSDEDNILKMLELAKKYKVKAIDFHGFKTKLQNDMQDYFYEKLKERNKTLYDHYINKLGRPKEFNLDKDGKFYKILADYCIKEGILFTKEEIDDYARKYENKKEGKQLSFFDLTQQ